MVERENFLKPVRKRRHSNDRYFAAGSTRNNHGFLSFTDGSKLLKGPIKTSSSCLTSFDIVKRKCSNIRPNNDEFSLSAIVQASYSCLFDDVYGPNNLIRLLCFFKYSDLVIQAAANEYINIRLVLRCN